ncbi:hypothetical protein ElyMa_001911500 [Elysia marginata]|uniref:C-type lectin domain-containing protein n=1 Tax=Elysia marginata TaxID=1093978 RepID=A0AAV4ESA5_9GAST|nr:hypothetical protein ElyMa_001911500 [Elysia marginata]
MAPDQQLWIQQGCYLSERLQRCRDNHKTPGWTANQNLKTCVRLYGQPKSWPDARSACQAQGGDLVVMKDTQTNSWVNSTFEKT